MAELPKVRERTDKLDAVGNTTAAIGKGFAIGSLDGACLVRCIYGASKIKSINIADPWVMSGLL